MKYIEEAVFKLNRETGHHRLPLRLFSLKPFGIETPHIPYPLCSNSVKDPVPSPSLDVTVNSPSPTSPPALSVSVV